MSDVISVNGPAGGDRGRLRELKRLEAAEPMDPLEPAWPLSLKALDDCSEFWCAVARAR